jgi:hypothetical protein
MNNATDSAPGVSSDVATSVRDGRDGVKRSARGKPKTAATDAATGGSSAAAATDTATGGSSVAASVRDGAKRSARGKPKPAATDSATGGSNVAASVRDGTQGSAGGRPRTAATGSAQGSPIEVDAMNDDKMTPTRARCCIDFSKRERRETSAMTGRPLTCQRGQKRCCGGRRPLRLPSSRDSIRSTKHPSYLAWSRARTFSSL